MRLLGVTEHFKRYWTPFPGLAEWPKIWPEETRKKCLKATYLHDRSWSRIQTGMGNYHLGHSEQTKKSFTEGGIVSLPVNC